MRIITTIDAPTFRHTDIREEWCADTVRRIIFPSTRSLHSNLDLLLHI
jgi:hypothetical protein